MSIVIFKMKDVLPKIFNLLIKRQFDFEFELLPYRAQEIGFRKAANFFVAGLNQYLQPERPFGYPVIAQVEPVNYCNLQCPLCLTSSMTKSRKPALLSFDKFQKFIDDCGDYLLHLILWDWGEPFLNPDLCRMIAYAKSKGIIVHTSTNGNVPLDDAQAEALVDSGLDSLVVAVDGATQKTYEQYRQGGRLDVVLSNIRKIIRIRESKRSGVPVINMRFVVMRHNESEIPLARELAKNLGVDYFTLKTVDMNPQTGVELDEIYAPEEVHYRRYEYDGNSFERKQKRFVCMRPWKRITLEASGEVIPCEYDYLNRYSLGNIAERSALDAWKSAKGKDFRKAFNLGHNDFYLCRDCTYKNSVVGDCVVERQVMRNEK
ncbi:MAG: radical SAM protein [Smithella sp.]|nr:radical SAM protein [Smithella sp.]